MEGLKKGNTKIITVGNQKGGAGKTTLSIHITLSLLYNELKLATVDLDSRQRSLSHYLENRRRYMAQKGVRLPFPAHFIVNQSNTDSVEAAREDERQRFTKCLNAACQRADIIVIDTPAGESYLSRLAHYAADIIVTPINDSFIDLDTIARIDPDSLEYTKLGTYGQMLCDINKRAEKLEINAPDWLVLRNRLSNIDANNKRSMAQAIEMLSEDLNFKISEGLSERVIYRELFLRGLSLLDATNEDSGFNFAMSHIGAKRELKVFMTEIEDMVKKRKENFAIEDFLSDDMQENIAKIFGVEG